MKITVYFTVPIPKSNGPSPDLPCHELSEIAMIAFSSSQEFLLGHACWSAPLER